MKSHEHAVFRFGGFVLVPSERLLLYEGQSLALTGRAFDLLAALVRNAGHLVSKDELFNQVWPGLVVEEVNLSVNIAAIRKVLARASDAASWIETVPRKGYRFNAPVEVEDVATLDLAQLRRLPAPYRSEVPGAAARTRPLWRGAKAAAVIVGIALALGLAYRVLLEGPSYASIAVLPFTVDAAGNSYLADGLVEGIINGLTPVRSLRVVPRASAFRFKDASPDPIAAGRQLDAATVVTGSLARASDRVMLQVELLDVKRRAQVWSVRYEVANADLPALQGRIMQDLAQALSTRLSGAELSSLSRRPSSNAEAYQAFLQGRFQWNQRSEPALQRAIAHFKHAIELDPNFAAAYAALADAHATLGYLGFTPPVSTFPVARPYALKALELDPSLAQAHASLAYIKFYFDWDWTGAKEEFHRAIELSPNDPVSHQWYAVYLLASGRAAEAFREIETAQRLDPLSLAINTDIGFHHYYNGRYPEAIAQLQSVLGMKSDFLLARLWLGRAFLAAGRFDEALQMTKDAESGSKEWPVLVTARGFTYAMVGKKKEAEAVQREMDELSKRRFVTAYGMALVHAGLGRKDDAFAWLEKAFEERSHWLVWLRLDPRWTNLRGDPRFQALIERMKYPAAI